MLQITFNNHNGARLWLPENRLITLSGGFGSEVEKKLGDGRSGIVKGSDFRAPIDAPDIVTNVHIDYALAGADILTADSFNASISRQNKDLGRVQDFARAAYARAHEAIVETKLSPLVAMSLTTSGDCCDPNDTPDNDVLTYEHLENVATLKQHGDFIIAETITTLREAQIIADIAQESQTPFVITFKAGTDGRTLDGHEMNEAVETILSEHSYCLGLGVNCCSIEGANLAVSELRAAFDASDHFEGKHIFAYPNGSKNEVCGPEGFDNHSPEEFAEELKTIVKNGATIIGGCCGTTPAHTQRYSEISQPVFA